ncbi:MAG: S8 family peptidase [Acetivibrio ethanolgignens]
MDRVSKIIHLDWARKRGIYGKGVCVAIIDTGIAPHPDFIYRKKRIVDFYDVLRGRIEPYDDSGHGTHVAGILAGSGVASAGRYMGVAPECSLVSVKVLNRKGNGSIADVLAGFDWVMRNKERYNIRILNISVGTAIDKDYSEDSDLVRGVNELWDAGIVVVAAAGNNGPLPQSIGSPGNSRKVITVGASDDDVLVELDGSRIKDYSSRGPTKVCIKKPDIVVPGSNIVSCSYRGGYTVKSGTSMATPIVSGAVALLLSRYQDMTPLEVKLRLKTRAVDMGMPHGKQGWGLLDIEKLLSG